MRVHLSHISIVVPDLESALKTLGHVYGLTCGTIAENREQGVRLAYVELSNARIELMQPTEADSPVGRFLTRHPNGGLHHLCLGVDAVAPVVDALGRQGICVLGDGTPRYNIHGQEIAFLHPKDFLGALVEIEETRIAHDPGSHQHLDLRPPTESESEAS